MKISFADAPLATTGSVAFLLPEGTALAGSAAELDRKTNGALKRAMTAADFKGKNGSILEITAPQGVNIKRIWLAGVGKKGDVATSNVELAAGELQGRAEKAKETNLTIYSDAAAHAKFTVAESAARAAFGAKLRAYHFNKYKTKLNDEAPKPVSLTVMTGSPAAARKAFAPLSTTADAINLTRDLVNEPANILHPEEFARRIKTLTKLGLKVEVLGEAQMEKLGMGSLLGVGQGSVRESQLVVMQWNGGKQKDKPIAFIGKGVCFDTGGISLKPGPGMEDMKGDMGGAACVTGTMYALAARKAKVNAIGVVGLVENMPDGNAQRPGDIVTSMSGQTIEILNTDAEGRLVLADALWYTQDRFQPRFMIDLATLTGAILIALGKEYAGLFSNNDELAKELKNAGDTENERVWRMPLGPVYDKMIDSKFADMKNIGGRDAGSITAAQFLQRFVNKYPWAHLDIAGTAMGSNQNAINQSWGSGWGVRLLDRLVADYYEKK
jgi:leucyl aminopeptidase